MKEVFKNNRKRDSEIYWKQYSCDILKMGAKYFSQYTKKKLFFTFNYKNGKCNSDLSLCDFVKLVWYRVFEI